MKKRFAWLTAKRFCVSYSGSNQIVKYVGKGFEHLGNLITE